MVHATELQSELVDPPFWWSFRRDLKGPASHPFLSLPCLFVYLGLTLFFSTARAATETPEDITRLDPFVVHGYEESLFGSTKAELERRPSSVVVISDNEIREGRGFNFEDVFQFAPGVYYQSRAGGNDGQLSLRGTNLSSNFSQWGITVLLNGLPMNVADGFFTFEAIDLLSVERIEVYKGSNALRFGSNTIGGAVNFIMKSGVNASRFQIRGQGGSFGFYNSQVSSGSVAKPFQLAGETTVADYYVSLTSSGQHGPRANNQSASIRFNTNIGLHIGDKHLLRVYMFNASTANDLPGPLTRAQLEANPRAAGMLPDVVVNPIVCSANEPCEQAEFNEVHRLGFAYQFFMDPEQSVTIAPFYQYWWLDLNLGQNFLQITHDLGAEVRYALRHKLGNIPHHLVVGWSPRFGEMRVKAFANNFGNRGIQLQDRFIQAVNWSGYWESQFDVMKRLTLIVGARLEYQTRDGGVRAFTGGVETSLRSDYRKFSAVSPKVGFMYRTTPTSQLYGNVSRVYEPPINIQLIQGFTASGVVPPQAFIDVDAQRGWQFELGHRGSAWNGDVRWDVTAFDLELQKEILVTELTFAGIGEIPTFRNAKGTRHTGVEAGGQLVVTRGLFTQADSSSKGDQVSIRSAYTWSRYRFTDDLMKFSGGAFVLDAQDGKTIPGVPEHWLTGELRYDHPSGFWIAPNIQWAIEGYFVDFVNIAQAPAFFVLNLKGGYQVDKQWKIFFEGRNLTDQTYAGSVLAGGFNTSPSLQPAVFFPAWPVSFFGGIEFVLP